MKNNQNNKSNSRKDHGMKTNDKNVIEINHVSDLWPDYLKGGYFDIDGNIKLEYLIRSAGKNDNGIEYGVEPLVKKMASVKPILNKHQLRKFFQHCRLIETKLKTNQKKWDEVKILIKKIDIVAAHSYDNYDNRKISKLFYDFLSENVKHIKDERDFLCGFLPHFEALVGFGSLYIKNERND